MHGRIGFVEFAASLLWWGLAEARGGQVGNTSGWSTAVSDVQYLLDKLLASGELKPKSKNDEAPGGKKKGKGVKRKHVEVEDDKESEPARKSHCKKQALQGLQNF
ncbi:hypothetical protein DFH09DRAFT_1321738 [Mycena vulgaris]|nr:hypothetical protein DFH09DRAFT_1321738 [Mycena vulgaris]